MGSKLNDRSYKHFFIAETCARMIEDKEVKSFFEFLISNKASNEYTSNLNKYVTDAKNEGIAIGEQRGERKKSPSCFE